MKNIMEKIGTKGKIAFLVTLIVILVTLIVANVIAIVYNPQTVETGSNEGIEHNEVNNILTEESIDENADDMANVIEEETAEEPKEKRGQKDTNIN